MKNNTEEWVQTVGTLPIMEFHNNGNMDILKLSILIYYWDLTVLSYIEVCNAPFNTLKTINSV